MRGGPKLSAVAMMMRNPTAMVSIVALMLAWSVRAGAARSDAAQAAAIEARLLSRLEESGVSGLAVAMGRIDASLVPERDRIEVALWRARGDTVSEMRGGVFYGGPGRDDVPDLYGGRFVGGRGPDWVGTQRGGTFLGKLGRDQVDFLQRGRFKGGPNGDRVDRQMTGGVFNGGPDTDTVKGYKAGTLYSVEVCKKPTNPCP